MTEFLTNVCLRVTSYDNVHMYHIIYFPSLPSLVCVLFGVLHVSLNLFWFLRCHSAEVNENLNLGYSQDQGYS